jgi:hypothetical protein
MVLYFRVTKPWLTDAVNRALEEHILGDDVSPSNPEAIVTWANRRPALTRRTSKPSPLDAVVAQLLLWLGPKEFAAGNRGECDAEEAVKQSVLVNAAIRKWSALLILFVSLGWFTANLVPNLARPATKTSLAGTSTAAFV